jgi:transketolase
MRLGRLAVPVINDRPDYKFEIGKGITLKDGDDLTIVATGLCVESAQIAAQMLEEEGIHARVINIHTIKPIDADLLIKAAKETGKIVTVEEHSVIGGLGSAVCDVLSENYPVPVKKIGVQDVFGFSGEALALIKEFKLDGQGVYDQIKEFLK